MSRHGEVTDVFHPPDEELEVLNIKKALIGTLSARLHASDKVLEKRQTWLYQLNETGHEGEHPSTYEVNPTPEGLVFHRTKHGHVVDNAKAKHEKKITYSPELGVARTVVVDEAFTAPRETKKGFNPRAGLPGDPEKHKQLQGDHFDLPIMHANSSSHMTLVGMKPFADDVTPPSNLTTGSIIIIHADLVFLELGFNDLCDSYEEPDIVALRIVSMATMIRNRASAQHVIIGEPLTRVSDPPGIPYNQCLSEYIPMLRAAARETPNVSTWSHIRLAQRNFPAYFARDGLHLSTHGNLLYYKSPKPPELDLAQIQDVIVGNLTCVRSHRRREESLQRRQCFLQVIALMDRLSENDLGALVHQHVKVNHSNSIEEENCNIMVDALGTLGTEAAQRLLTKTVLQARGAPAKLIQRMLISFVSMTTPPVKDFVKALEDLCFARKIKFEDPKDEWLVHNTAVLILGVVADRLKETDKEAAKGLVGQLEDSLGIHDPWHHRHLRSTMAADELEKHYHGKATLLESLGNAEFDSSFDHLLSYVNNTDSPPLLRRSALTAIRKYDHHEAASLLLDSALFDEEEHVRYHAALQYQRHPKALNLLKIKQDFANGSINIDHYLDDLIGKREAMSDDSYLRRRRGVERFFEPIVFYLNLPGIDWQKKIGTEDIGADFGLVVKNIFDFNIGVTKGHVKVDVDDRIYARGLLGIIGERFDFIDAGICFKGSIKYEINILQDFSFEQLLDLINVWFESVPRLIDDIIKIVETFHRLFDRLASLENVFQNIMDTEQNTPEAGRGIARQAGQTWEKVAAYNNLPSFIEEARQGVSDSTLTVLPWAAEQIWQGLTTLGREVPKLIRSPQTATGNIAKAVYKIYKAVMTLIKIRDITDEVFLFKEGKQPFLFEVGTEVQQLLDDFTRVRELLQTEAPNWIKGRGQRTERVLEDAFGDLGSARSEVDRTVNEALDELETPLQTIGNIAGPFREAYDATFGTIKSAKMSFDSLKNASGVSTRTYESRGIDLVLPTNREVVAPFAGEITSITSQSIAIATDEIKGMEAIVEGINPASSIKPGQMIDKGEAIGTAGSTGCGTNTIHFAIREKGSSKYVDPTKYVPPPGMMKRNEQPGWVQGCDDYWLTFMDKSIGSGKLTGGQQEKQETPEAPTTNVNRRAR
ncbi:hypothetical protein Bbelb_361310 [Branchiostoma belcheri]|nr:hypothetical protein Bbelb_361310 [Branchiostoma belcheri]